MSAESDLLQVIEPAAYYYQQLKELEENKVTGPGITVDLTGSYLAVTKEE